MDKEPVRKTLAKAGIPLRDEEIALDLTKERERAMGIAFAGRVPARDFLSRGDGIVTLGSVNAVLVSLGWAIGQVVSNLESPADSTVAAVDGLLKGIVAEREPADRETVLDLLNGPAKKRAGRRRG